ncbi:MAG: hypothetical protein CO088_01275 [Candidatus Yonathbacteria bacterium CG_4_9_14_0_8_um_filter_46_47]|uniref:PsbP C-terminal domain-containing protein n=1 Tax=Candidatus Yonathbacteria bacterium CG_4_9_14_0_8_um_filter_46_47 TaxID=1975106 RepID=A0A2M8D8N9_9BACT|nr:MAG: hypothetical protein CO088_01275 [Candidatus Yonathbacteria bacterium CG_4_9_14_0_8_um_filter_46_47]PJC19722.1 MAG: hypothetical protein CO061_04425 [Candidatus Yonathbacteria bacterium CG_4_9_14_0_2_um_filter_47_74]
MNQKGFANIILVVVIVILVGAIGYFVFIKKSEPIAQQSTSTPTQTKTPLPPTSTPTKTPAYSTPAPKDETANWKSYRNDQYGFELKYPEDWRTAQCGIDCQGFGPQSVREDIAVGINVLNSKLDTAKKSLPVLSNSYNKIIKEETVIVEGTQWTKLTIKQDIAGEIFIEHLIEKSGKTYDLGVGTDELNIVNIYNQILSTFRFTK